MCKKISHSLYIAKLYPDRKFEGSWRAIGSVALAKGMRLAMDDSIFDRLIEIRQLAERMLSVAGSSPPADACALCRGPESALRFKVEQRTDSGGSGNPAARREADLPRLIATAKAIYALRQRRDPIFTFDACKEPHWDIVLDLFINRAAGRRVSMTSACIASNRPITTALRWLDYLEEKGVVQKIPCEFDSRKTYVELTLSTYSKMLEYLDEVGRTFANLGKLPVSPQLQALHG